MLFKASLTSWIAGVNPNASLPFMVGKYSLHENLNDRDFIGGSSGQQLESLSLQEIAWTYPYDVELGRCSTSTNRAMEPLLWRQDCTPSSPKQGALGLCPFVFLALLYKFAV